MAADKKPSDRERPKLPKPQPGEDFGAYVTRIFLDSLAQKRNPPKDSPEPDPTPDEAEDPRQDGSFKLSDLVWLKAMQKLSPEELKAAELKFTLGPFKPTPKE